MSTRDEIYVEVEKFIELMKKHGVRHLQIPRVGGDIIIDMLSYPLP